MSTGVPSLGSKLSLISKSEIRYEGILYAIDTKEATLALAKVKSFGTEDRPTDRPVSRRDEVYDYIVFRASDIKDLHVCELPKPQPTLSGLPADPAIVQHSGSVSASAQYSIPYSQPYICGFQHFPNHSHIPSYFPSSHVSGPTRSTTQTSQRKSPTNDAGVQVSVAIDSDTNLSAEISQEQIKQRPAREQRDNVQMQSGMQSQQQNLSNRRGQGGRRRGGPRRGWGRGRGGSNYTRDVLKFDNEYDFEQANAEFQELETKLAKAKLDEPEPESEPMANGDVEECVGAYDKKKSFFDDISCDSSQRSKGLPRFDWRVERRLNVETFGVSTSNSWFRRRRGRGGFRRGYRSRGGMMRSQPEIQKTVTFDDKPTIKEVEVIEAVEVLEVAEINSKPEEIPVIELVVEKEKTDWPEGSKTDPVWN